jgi:dodecin
MSRVAKIIEIVGNSETSWQDAADVALQEAARTIHNISGIQVGEMSAEVENGRVKTYRTTLRIAFAVERPSEQQ